MPIAENLIRLRSELPRGVELVAVSKTHPPEAIMEAYIAGQRIFGENRPQEMASKRSVLASLPAPPEDIVWHQIGHLQTNKVKLIAPFVSLVHSVDSARLVREIDRQALANGREIDVLLEIKIAREESKEGWDAQGLFEWFETGEYRALSGVRFRGTMGVASNADDEGLIRSEFETLLRLHAAIRERFFFRRDETLPCGPSFDIVSMGMSSDYKIALAVAASDPFVGTTMVRIGSLVFGSRGGQ